MPDPFPSWVINTSIWPILCPAHDSHPTPQLMRGFLVAKSNSIRGFVRPSVHRSVRPSVTRFSKTANSSKFNKIQQNSTKFTTFRNCWPSDGLVFSRIRDVFPHWRGPVYDTSACETEVGLFAKEEKLVKSLGSLFPPTTFFGSMAKRYFI